MIHTEAAPRPGAPEVIEGRIADVTDIPPQAGSALFPEADAQSVYTAPNGGATRQPKSGIRCRPIGLSLG